MSTRQLNDPVRAALSIFTSIKRELESTAESKELGRKLRARARDAPELVEEIGLVPTLSFFYSKKKDADYKLILKAILLYLKEIGVLGSAKDVDNLLREGGTDAMVEVLLELRGKSAAIVPILRPFLVEFKRLCEATWEEGERK
ncbi:MAG: type III-B CRISPR module-associated protein Cmr5 [Thermofilum sp.]